MKNIAEEMMYMKQDLENIKSELGCYELELVDDLENRLLNIQEELYSNKVHNMYISITYKWRWWFEHHVAHDMYSALKCVDALMDSYWWEHLVWTDAKNILPLLYEKDWDQIKVELKDEDEVIEIE